MGFIFANLPILYDTTKIRYIKSGMKKIIERYYKFVETKVRFLDNLRFIRTRSQFSR